MNYRLFLKKGSDQLIVTLYSLPIYPSVHNQLIRTFFEAWTLYGLKQKKKCNFRRKQIWRDAMNY